jgi:hypothetical protein
MPPDDLITPEQEKGDTKNPAPDNQPEQVNGKAIRPLPEASAPEQDPSSQGGDKRWLKRLPAVVQQLPFPPFNYVPKEPDPNYQLIKLDELTALATKDAAIDERMIRDDVRFLDYELLRMFRQRDHNAKKHQLRYQRFQILYLLLAAAAGLVGSIQALEFESNPQIMPVFSFGETLIALLATFLATISGRQAPLQEWLKNRQRAEALRREYFRYLTRVTPYEEHSPTGGFREPHQLKMLLARRAANLNRGVDPPIGINEDGALATNQPGSASKETAPGKQTKDGGQS